ncbi:MAG: Gfo/Idh/MocA family oxidoreductase [Chitinophagales bacterium]|nr:Gfo/Idh/MocA family oxidoreductase [Chitinophagales bacterium]
MNRKIGFTIVGFGHIGRRHAQMILEHPNAQLLGVADINPLCAEVAQDDFHTPFYNSTEDLLKAELQPDVVCICTPNGLHTKLAISALEKGCNVVIEKPMGLSKADCEEVIFKSLQMSKQVFCVMQNRYSPPAKWLKSLINEKRLGKIYTVQVNCYWNRDERYYKKNSWKGSKELDGGPLFTQFSHFVDMMYWLFGDIRDIQARFENNNHQQSTQFLDDSGLVSFHFLNGGMGCFNYSTSVWDTNLESSMTIIGEHGSVKVGGQYMEKVEYCHIRNYTMPELPPSNPPNDYGGYKGSAANHHFVIENVVDVLLGNSTISTNALEGMKVVEIIERIYGVGKSK